MRLMGIIVVAVALSSCGGRSQLGTVVPFVANQGEDPTALVADNEAIYYVDALGHRVVRVDKTTKATQVLLSGFGEGEIAIDDTSLYVSGGAFPHRFILRLPKTGGEAQRIASNLPGAGHLAVDATRVFFVDPGNDVDTVDGLRSIPKTGGPVTTIATLGGDRVADFTIDATHAYVSTREQSVPKPWTRILRIALDGSKKEVWAFAHDPLSFKTIRNDANAVYWTTGFEGVVPPGTTTVQKKCK